MHDKKSKLVNEDKRSIEIPVSRRITTAMTISYTEWWDTEKNKREEKTDKCDYKEKSNWIRLAIVRLLVDVLEEMEEENVFQMVETK